MESRSILDYIFFGTALRYAQDVSEGWWIHTPGGILPNLDHMLDKLKTFSLPVSHQGSGDLYTIAAELRETPDDAKMSAEQATRLRGAMSKFRHTLEAEAQLNIAFIATEKRIDVRKLLGDVASLMQPGVMPQLPPIARHDLPAAGRCIAFELPTAAAFHALRATEDVLRQFYRCVIRQNRLKNPMWAGMIDQMAKKQRNRPDEPLLDVLDRIRVNYRNPTNHPDAIYDIHEAQDLFLACLEAISRMVKSPLRVKPATS